MLFPSPVSLFISRTEPVSKGDWGGYWGTSSIVEHFGALYSGTFRIDPDYAEERVVGLTPDVAETYAPVIITSGYGGQAPIARRFLMVLEWVKTPDVGGSQPTNPCRYRPRHRSFIEPSSPVTSERQKSRQTIPTSDLLSSRTTPSVVPW
jgi:hypothetical protein